eukprot:CAMPEP_0170491306 /NCGR_PEP_ID=MMETSP0208-20121228/10760_1 /TAXON_ID=197538 /ORGANISM="Strombidium inclinatum, Strain S3" /LENGTH=326 /DNA_ID=CAMNT_0010766859 /DNA_START=84 /DNA_END=1064 /DNA_ORIENTATION=+
MIEFALRGIEAMKPKTPQEEERDQKHPEFRRHDLDKLTRKSLYWMAPLIVPRWIIGWGAFMVFFGFIMLISLFVPADQPYSGWSKKLVSKLSSFTITSFVSMKGPGSVNVKTMKVDYSKYLGPDWEMDFDSPGTVVSNHVSWGDIIFHMIRQPPAFIGKASIKDIPFAGSIFKKCGCMFFDRSSSKQKKGVLEQIEDRQKLSEEGVLPPLVIYAEGGTSNGDYILKFKKGAFFSLRSVQPVVLKYKDFYPVNVENCAMPIYFHIILLSTILTGSAELLEYPVFRPNEYFFKHHQREGEQKWESFARVVREIMAEGSGLKLSDSTIE